MSKVAGKAAVILGAAGRGNIGQAVARRFACEGAKVMIAGRHEAVLQELARDIGASYCLCDVTSRTDLDTLAAKTLEQFGSVDVGINAVGWALTRPFLKTSSEEIAKISAVQFGGSFQFMQVMIEAMHRGGSLIQISSVSTRIMVEHHAAYMATKTAADCLVRCVANEFGSRGIRANSISPGLTESPMTRPIFANAPVLEAYRSQYPSGRVGTGGDIAEAALWLASDECFMTGENLHVNGGLSLRGFPDSRSLVSAIERASPEKQAEFARLFGSQ